MRNISVLRMNADLKGFPEINKKLRHKQKYYYDISNFS